MVGYAQVNVSEYLTHHVRRVIARSLRLCCREANFFVAIDLGRMLQRELFGIDCGLPLGCASPRRVFALARTCSEGELDS